jgi:hypothetical protein
MKARRKKGDSEHMGIGGTGEETVALQKNWLALQDVGLVRRPCRARTAKSIRVVLTLKAPLLQRSRISPIATRELCKMKQTHL